MLISQLIQKLERIRSESGDLPVYYKDNDWVVIPLSGTWVEKVDEIQAENSDLEVGMPIAIIAD